MNHHSYSVTRCPYSTTLSACNILSSPFFFYSSTHPRHLHSFPTRRSSDLAGWDVHRVPVAERTVGRGTRRLGLRDREEHTSELQSRFDLVCRLLLEKKKKKKMRVLVTQENTQIIHSSQL